jgi:transcription-repair coupling factor (superfamily II helicase)
VGLDLYCRLLAESVERLRAMRAGETPPPPKEGPQLTIDLPLSAHLPHSYVPDLNQRLALYQRMSDAADPREVESLGQEMVDRFGDPPPAAGNLLFVVLLRVLAARAGVQAVSTEDGQAVVRLKEGSLVPKEALEPRAPKGVHLGRTLLRVDLSEGWRRRLRLALEALAEAEPALAQS